jgi:serine/threonine protein kinase
MPLSAGTRLGAYEILAAIGVGGMGEVYRATDTNLGRQVAIKVLPDTFAHDPERLARFEREAKTLAALNHPNIAGIHGLEHAEGTRALVMELVEGPTLAEAISQGPVPLDEALHIAKQIAEALDAAHEQGIVHRDLKPANIKVREDGTVKVLDFGLAKVLEPAGAIAPGVTQSPTITSPAMATIAGMLLGTAAYMSPEQARGKPADKRADIWAFGCVLYEMIAGEPLFKGEDVTEVLASVVKGHPDLGRVPTRVRRVIARCVTKDAKARLRDIGDVWELLDAPAESTSAQHTRPQSLLLARLAWTMMGLAILALAVPAVVHLREAPTDPVVIRSTILPPENAVFDFDVTRGPVAISPDGSTLVFAARSAGGSQLWVRPLDSPTARPLNGTTNAVFPFWSPDGRTVGFSRRGRLFKVAVSGGPPTLITNEVGIGRVATWAPGGTIIFDKGGRELWTVAAGGGQAVRHKTPSPGDGPLRSPWFLPGGRRYLYWAGEKTEIRAGSLDSDESQLLTQATSNAIYASGHLLFLREHTLLAQPFDPVRSMIADEAVPIADNVSRLVETQGVFTASETGTLVYQAGGSEATLDLAWFDRTGRRLSTVTELGDARGLSVDRDRTFTVVQISDSQRRPALWRINLVSGQQTRLTPNLPGLSSAAWSPDGREIVYVETRDDQRTLVRKSSSGVGDGVAVYAPARDSQAAGLMTDAISSWPEAASRSCRCCPRNLGPVDAVHVRQPSQRSCAVFPGRPMGSLSDFPFRRVCHFRRCIPQRRKETAGRGIWNTAALAARRERAVLHG